MQIINGKRFEDHPTMPGWIDEAFLSMPWGARHYRFKDLDENLMPKTVEVMLDGIWQRCPNINVALRIQGLLKA